MSKPLEEIAAAAVVAYTAGPITGDPDYFAKFSDAECKLTARGYSVLNPCKMPVMPYWKHMIIDFAMVDVCDILCLLPGWEKSSGARSEYRRALARGKTILTLEELLKTKIDT